MNQLKLVNKEVPCYDMPEASRPRCLVYLLDVYLEKLPLFAFEKNVFYCRPKKFYTGCSTWYESVPVGKNKLSNIVREMCIDANIDVKTNHSLRATGATALFHGNVPEKIIQNVTGHRSVEALRKYERTSKGQHQATSNVLMSKEPSSYAKHLNIATSE